MPHEDDGSRGEGKAVREPSGGNRSPGMMAYWWGVFLLVWPAVGVFLITRSLTQAEERDAKQALTERVERLEALRKADRETLGRYHWIDRDKGIVALPIERAMELEGERLKSKEVGPSKVLLPGALLRQRPSPAPKP